MRVWVGVGVTDWSHQVQWKGGLRGEEAEKGRGETYAFIKQIRRENVRRIHCNCRNNVLWGRTGWWRCGCVGVGVTSCLLFDSLTSWDYTFELNKNVCQRIFLAIQICGIYMCICDMVCNSSHLLIFETHRTFMYDMITGLFCAISRLYITYILHLLSLLQSKIKTHS